MSAGETQTVLLTTVTSLLQVKERRCVMAANTEPGQTVKMDKCTVEVGDQQCTEVILQLPRQACPARVNKTLSYGGYSG